MTGERLSHSLAQVAAARRIFTRNAERQSPEQSRALVSRWIDHYRLPESSVSGVMNGATILPPVDEYGWWTIDADLNRACARTLFYLHGGGFVYYSAQTFVPLLTRWALANSARMFVFDYPKAPEHDVKTIFAHVENVVSRALTQIDAEKGPEPLVAGDSVGGMLALYLATHALPHRFARVTLIYPVLSLHCDWLSYRTFGTGFFLDADDMRWFSSLLVPAVMSIGFDPFSLTADVLPSCRVHVAGCDVLRDEALAWASLMRNRNAQVDLVEHEDLAHDFCLYAGKLLPAQQAVDRIGSTLFL